MDFLRLLVILLIALPAVAAVVAVLLGPGRTALIRQVCLGATIADAVIALVLALGFIGVRSDVKVRPLNGQDRVFVGAQLRPDLGESKELTTFRPEIVPGAIPGTPDKTSLTLIDLGDAGAIQFYVGLDGLNIWLIVLTAVLMVAAVLISWDAITERTNEYYAWLMALGAAMLGVFLSFDIILFYIFFELTLVPLFFLIGIWGGPERRYASRKFFIYTLAGSLITLLGLLAVVVVSRGPGRPYTFAIPELIAQVQQLAQQHAASDDPAMRAFWVRFEFWVFLAMMVGFAVKVPLFPVHTWLPLAQHRSADRGQRPPGRRAAEAGHLRISTIDAAVGPRGGAQLRRPPDRHAVGDRDQLWRFLRRAQDDIKKLVAYSSVSHLGFCTLGLFALNATGLTGGLLQMLNHGLSTGALFLLVGMLYERYHTRQMSDYSGMAARLGWLAAAFVFVSLTSVGLPGLNGFIGEALVFFGMFDVNPALAVLGTAGIILGAWYLFTMLRVVFFGGLKEPAAGAEHQVADLNGREIATLAPILLACLFLGVYPQPVIDSIKPDVQIVANILQNRAVPPSPQRGRGVGGEGAAVLPSSLRVGGEGAAFADASPSPPTPLPQRGEERKQEKTP